MMISEQAWRGSPLVSGFKELVPLNWVCLVFMWPCPEYVPAVLKDPSYFAHGHRVVDLATRRHESQNIALKMAFWG